MFHGPPPPYLPAYGLDDVEIRYVWDDSRASDDFVLAADDVVDRMLLATPRAQVAAGIGLYEWVLWRFRRLSGDPLPFQVASAAWCAIVDRRYMKTVELDRTEWLGPVRGPLWCAVTWLVPMLFAGRQQFEEYESGLRYLSRLALHVVPVRPALETWLQQVADRIVQLHPGHPDDPFTDLFGEDEASWLGELVAPEILDPGQPYDPVSAPDSLSHYLAQADWQANPLLHSPHDMIRQGFDNEPYKLG